MAAGVGEFSGYTLTRQESEVGGTCVAQLRDVALPGRTWLSRRAGSVARERAQGSDNSGSGTGRVASSCPIVARGCQYHAHGSWGAWRRPPRAVAMVLLCSLAGQWGLRARVLCHHLHQQLLRSTVQRRVFPVDVDSVQWLSDVGYQRRKVLVQVGCTLDPL